MCYYVNNMKRIIPAILLLLALTGCYNSGEPRERVLKIYNWADYIGEGVLEDFQAYYKEQTGENIRIVYQTFDINEIMLTKIEKGHEDFDVVCPSEYIIERMLKKHLLLPIDTNFAHSPNYMNNVAPFIRKQINKLSQPGEKASRYAVCYMWGTAGILYNRAYVPDSVALSWDCLWNKKYAGKILMKDSYRDAYGTAVIYAHAKELKEGTVTVEELMNDYSPRAMELAEKYLKALKPNIAGWEADFGKEMMTKNKAWLNMTWSGRHDRFCSYQGVVIFHLHLACMSLDRLNRKRLTDDAGRCYDYIFLRNAQRSRACLCLSSCILHAKRSARIRITGIDNNRLCLSVGQMFLCQ